VRWSDIEDELTDEENVDLWQQCGEIVKRIHATMGEQFGYPYPGRQFANWHDVILDRFSRIAQSMKKYDADLASFATITNLVNSTPSIFNEVHTLVYCTEICGLSICLSHTKMEDPSLPVSWIPSEHGGAIH